jgi:hypothetical protein
MAFHGIVVTSGIVASWAFHCIYSGVFILNVFVSCVTIKNVLTMFLGDDKSAFAKFEKEDSKVGIEKIQILNMSTPKKWGKRFLLSHLEHYGNCYYMFRIVSLYAVLLHVVTINTRNLVFIFISYARFSVSI